MNSYDYNAVVIDCSVYCVDCMPEGISIDSEDVSPVFADSEWDYYPVCDHCGTEHDYVSLTTDGRREVWKRTLPDAWHDEVDRNGKLDAYAWPGGYPLYYLTGDGLAICHTCANDQEKSDPPVARDANWEDAELCCDDCGERIESAYAES